MWLIPTIFFTAALQKDTSDFTANIHKSGVYTVLVEARGAICL